MVEKVLRDLDAGKSMGPDELNPLLLKTMSKAFSVPLSLIFQESRSVLKMESAGLPDKMAFFHFVLQKLLVCLINVL